MINSPNSYQLMERMLDDQECTYVDQQHSLQHTDTDPQLSANPDVVQMVIELDSQNSVTIQIGRDDDPLTLAKRFCYQYSIDPRIINTLASNIRHAKSTLQQSLNADKQNSSHCVQQHNYSSHYGQNQIHHNASFSSTNNKHQKSHSKQNLKYESASHHKVYPHDRINTSALSHSSQSVFDRLYQDSRNKQLTKKMTTLATQSTRKSFKQRPSLNSSQNCSLLYQKNIKLKQETKRKSELLFQDKQQKEQAQCTHQPKINVLSRIIAERLKDNECSYMSSSQEKRNHRILEYLREKQDKQMEQCTFEPKVLKRSRDKSITNNPTERFLLLHQDHNLRQTKRKMVVDKLYEDKYVFEPRINAVSTAIVRGKKFFQRLKQYQQQKKEKEAQQQRKRKSQQKRRPSTGRGPINRQKAGMNIGEYLYEKHKTRRDDKSRSKSKSKDKKKLIIPKSEAIYEERKVIAFRYLFTLMDGDEDGLISATKINITGLSDQMLRLISPLLSQMEEIKAQLDEQQFVQSFSRLFNTFSIHQKNNILRVYKHQHNPKYSQEPSFQPSINEKSQIMAMSKQPRISLYELWKQNCVLKEARMAQIRTQIQIQEYDQCTFHPNLFPDE